MSSQKLEKSYWKKILLAIIFLFLILSMRACVKFIELSGCTGGIDGHSYLMSDKEKQDCLKAFPKYDFPYRDEFKEKLE